MARVLITGGSGFIGTNLVHEFLQCGDTVVNVDTRPPRNPAHAACWRASSAVDGRRLAELVEEFAPELVFHCAARTDLAGSSEADYRDNVAGTQTILDVVGRARGVGRLVVLSSMLVCRLGYVPRSDDDYCPSTAYGASKARAEQCVRGTDATPWVIVRPTSIWGPWFGPPYREFFRSVAQGRFRAPRGWSTLRSLGFVGNTVHQLLRLARADAADVAGRTFYLCDYQPVRLIDWAAAVAQACRARRPPEISMAVLRALARAGDALQALHLFEPPITTFRLRNMLTDAVFGTAQLEAVCGALPFGLEQGIAQTVAWMRQQQLI
jgi:nucleoside-diphosphate-sugar epimerase